MENDKKLNLFESTIQHISDEQLIDDIDKINTFVNMTMEELKGQSRVLVVYFASLSHMLKDLLKQDMNEIYFNEIPWIIIRGDKGRARFEERLQHKIREFGKESTSNLLGNVLAYSNEYQDIESVRKLKFKKEIDEKDSKTLISQVENICTKKDTTGYVGIAKYVGDVNNPEFLKSNDDREFIMMHIDLYTEEDEEKRKQEIKNNAGKNRLGSVYSFTFDLQPGQEVDFTEFLPEKKQKRIKSKLQEIEIE